MANTFTKQVIVDGPKDVIIHAYLASDGSTGDITDGVLVDVSALTPIPTSLTLVAIKAYLVGFTAVLEWDASTDVPVMGLPTDIVDFCFKEMGGGIPNNAGTGKTGDLLITTSGFTASGDVGFITIHCRKN